MFKEKKYSNMFFISQSKQILMLVIVESSENLIVQRKEVIRNQIVLQEFIDAVSNHNREVRRAHI